MEVYLVNLFPLMREKVFSTREKAESFINKVVNKELDFINYDVNPINYSKGSYYEIVAPGLNPIVLKYRKLTVE